MLSLSLAARDPNPTSGGLKSSTAAVSCCAVMRYNAIDQMGPLGVLDERHCSRVGFLALQRYCGGRPGTTSQYPCYWLVGSRHNRVLFAAGSGQSRASAVAQHA